MKRFLLMIVVVLTTLSANAQIYVGGEFGIWRNSTTDKTHLTIAPSVGYEFSETWAVGGELKYSFRQSVANKFEIAPYARYSFYHNKLIKLFLDFGAGMSVNKPNHEDSDTGFQIGIQPGIALHLNHHFAILAKAGFVGYNDNCIKEGSKGFGIEMDGENLKFGIEYTF